MRIIAGKYRGRVVHPPKDLPVRPTTDMAREGLFNILSNQMDLEDLQVLDIFAGTGLVSLEFHSRGVAKVTSVDASPKCVAFMKKLKDTFIPREWDIQKSDAIRYLQSTIGRYDLVFMDPPYAMPQKELLVQAILDRDLLHPSGLIVMEHATQESFEHLKAFENSRSYGGSTFSFFVNPKEITTDNQ